MPYELFYGSPFASGIGMEMFAGARRKERFARRLEMSRMALQERALDLQEAGQAMTMKLQEMQEKRLSDAAAQAAAQWRDQKALDQDRLKLDQERLRQTQTEIDQKGRLLEEARGEQTRTERHQVLAAGGRALGAGETPRAGEYRHEVGGQAYAVPTEAKSKLDALLATLEAKKVAPGEEYTEVQKAQWKWLEAERDTLLKLGEQGEAEALKIERAVREAAEGRRPLVDARGKPLKGAAMAEATAHNETIDRQIADLRAKASAADPTRLQPKLRAFAMYHAGALKRPAILDELPPARLHSVNWAALDAEDWRLLELYFSGATDPRFAQFALLLINRKSQ